MTFDVMGMTVGMMPKTYGFCLHICSLIHFPIQTTKQHTPTVPLCFEKIS